MGIIKNFNSFANKTKTTKHKKNESVDTLVRKEYKVKTSKPTIEEGEALDVMERLNKIYLKLSDNERKEIDKYFEEYLKEEVDLKGNKGIPDDFMKKAERHAKTNLEIDVDDERQMAPQEMGGKDLGRELFNWLNRSNDILSRDENNNIISDSELKERKSKLEKLAKEVVLSEFGELLELSTIPVELDIKLVDMGKVSDEIDMDDVESESEQPDEEDQEEQDKKDQEEKEEDYEDDIENPVPGTKFSDAIDKKKILNMMTQAAGKSVKHIIRYSEVVKNVLKEIFGSKGNSFRTSLIMLSEVADKMDWVVPINKKASAMKNAPSGMAGAVDIIWESHSGNQYGLEFLLEKEASKVVIKAVGVDFAMLIHEAVKGIYLFLQSGSIKKDKETAKIIKNATSSFYDESQDFRYGPQAYKMLLLFVNKFEEFYKYSKLDTRVFTILALDKERAIHEYKNSKPEWKEFFKKKAEICLSDSEFLDVMKSIFSTIDLTESGEYELNESKFNTSIAKSKIKNIINYIVEDIEDYKKDIADWEEEQRSREEIGNQKEEEESEVDKLVRQALQQNDTEETVSDEIDYSKLTQRELQELIDNALDEGDYEKVGDLSQFLESTSRSIYLKELERINENRRK